MKDSHIETKCIHEGYKAGREALRHYHGADESYRGCDRGIKSQKPVGMGSENE